MKAFHGASSPLLTLASFHLTSTVQYWLWCCWCADILGGLFGAALYDTLIFTGAESPMNRRWGVKDLNPLVWPRKVKRGFRRIRNEWMWSMRVTLWAHKEEDREAAVVEKV